MRQLLGFKGGGDIRICNGLSCHLLNVDFQQVGCVPALSTVGCSKIQSAQPLISHYI
jgi:hypothetical protein